MYICSMYMGLIYFAQEVQAKSPEDKNPVFSFPETDGVVHAAVVVLQNFSCLFLSTTGNFSCLYIPWPHWDQDNSANLLS